MRPDNFDVHDLINYLQGSCESIDSGVHAVCEGMEWADLTDEDHVAIDNDIFCCEQCGWWFEQGDRCSDGDQACKDCNPDCDEEDD